MDALTGESDDEQADPDSDGNPAPKAPQYKGWSSDKDPANMQYCSLHNRQALSYFIELARVCDSTWPPNLFLNVFPAGAWPEKLAKHFSSVEMTEEDPVSFETSPPRKAPKTGSNPKGAIARAKEKAERDTARQNFRAPLVEDYNVRDKAVDALLKQQAEAIETHTANLTRIGDDYTDEVKKVLEKLERSRKRKNQPEAEFNAEVAKAQDLERDTRDEDIAEEDARHTDVMAALDAALVDAGNERSEAQRALDDIQYPPELDSPSSSPAPAPAPVPTAPTVVPVLRRVPRGPPRTPPRAGSASNTPATPASSSIRKATELLGLGGLWNK